MAKDYFEGFEAAKIFERGTPLTAGTYDVEVEAVKIIQTRIKGDAFIMEGRVVTTSDPAKHPVGSKRSWYQSMRDPGIAFGSIKAFLWATMGFDLNSDAQTIKTELEPNAKKLIDEAYGPTQSLKGERVHVECVMITTKENKPFTRHDWSPYQGAAVQQSA